MCLRFGDGESCSVKSEELRGKLKPHNGNIMGLVSESRRRAGGGTHGCRHPLLPQGSITGFRKPGRDNSGSQTSFRDTPTA